jgi:hypothetical protein
MRAAGCAARESEPSRMHRRLFALLLVAASLSPAPSRAAAGDFVTASGPALMLHGKPWAAVGANVWDFDAGKAVHDDPSGCYYQRADLDAYLDSTFSALTAATHATVVRTFGFLDWYTGGGTDWSSTDRLVHYARRYNVRLIAVLGNQYALCGTPAKTSEWYHCFDPGCVPGYKRDDGPWGVSYRDYVVALARRYRDEPAIAMWQLMNEADPTSAGSGPDGTALSDFSRDMARAIRTDAGDANHLMNLGTTGGGARGNGMPYWAKLLDCGTSSGGCNDAGEVHAHDFTDPVPGAPLTSSVGTAVRVWNANGADARAGGLASIDAWGNVDVTLPTSGSSGAYTDWALRFTGPSGGAWSAYIDDVTVQTAAGPRAYTFETGTEGFTSGRAALSASAEQASSGAASLKAAVPAGTTTFDIDGPALPSAAQSVRMKLRLSFGAPAPQTASTIASDMHAATIARAKPFFVGEAGIRAQVPGLNGCASRRTLSDRAQTIDRMLAVQLDADHAGSGVVVWDWKDPSQPSVRADGSAVQDPTLDCWTVTPGDPVEVVLRRHADLRPADALPAPAPLDYSYGLAAFAPPPARAAANGDERVGVRVTRGGSPARGARVIASGGCTGTGVADALGNAAFSCHAGAPGRSTVTLRVDPGTCGGCASPELRYDIDAKTKLGVEAVAGVARRGAGAPVDVTLADPSGATLKGTRWAIDECGLSGTVASDGARAHILATCPAPWNGVKTLRFTTGETATAWDAETSFAGVTFDRLYVDGGARECVGIDIASGLVGATAAPGKCDAASHGGVGDWWFYVVQPGQRADAFRQTPAGLVVNVQAGGGRSIQGVFSGSGFTALVLRPDGAHALRG